MKEYFLEGGEGVDIGKLKAGFIERGEFIVAHRGLPIVCHDVFIAYKGGILTVERNNEPMKGERWIIGGRIQRGVRTEDSLKDKVKKECGLDLRDIKYLGSARIFQSTEPFGHGHGADCPVFVYFARGSGELNLDKLHKRPVVLDRETYRKIRNELHPYMQDFMDVVIEMV